MHKFNVLEEIPKRGDWIELTAKSRNRNHLGERFNWVCEFSKVTKIIKNGRGDVVAIKLAGSGKLIKSVRVSRRCNCFFATIENHRVEVTLEIPPQEN